jgi:hypothetical protein
MSVRFVIGSGARRIEFVRAPLHTGKWDQQKEGFRLMLGMPAHGHATK